MRVHGTAGRRWHAYQTRESSARATPRTSMVGSRQSGSRPGRAHDVILPPIIAFHPLLPHDMSSRDTVRYIQPLDPASASPRRPGPPRLLGPKVFHSPARDGMFKVASAPGAGVSAAGNHAVEGDLLACPADTAALVRLFLHLQDRQRRCCLSSITVEPRAHVPRGRDSPSVPSGGNSRSQTASS